MDQKSESYFRSLSLNGHTLEGFADFHIFMRITYESGFQGLAAVVDATLFGSGGACLMALMTEGIPTLRYISHRSKRVAADKPQTRQDGGGWTWATEPCRRKGLKTSTGKAFREGGGGDGGRLGKDNK